MARRRFGKKLGIGCLGAVVVLAALVAFTGPGQVLQSLVKSGILGDMLSPERKRTYSASNEGNLKALRTALMLYHDSEGQFPMGAGWMDAIQDRIQAGDMEKTEAAKKLIRPDLTGKADQFGYAINDKAAGRYKDDVGAKTVLVYESKQSARNAHGDPATDRDGMSITVDGTIQR